jgi:hypothetical protein
MIAPQQKVDPFARPDVRWLLFLAGTVTFQIASAALFARFAGAGFSWLAFLACLLPAFWSVYLLSTYRSFMERVITWAALAGAIYWAMPALAMLGIGRGV